MVWSHSVKIFQVIHGELWLFKALLSNTEKPKAENSRTDRRCLFGLYTDEFFILGKGNQNVLRTYDRVREALEHEGLPPKPSKRERAHKNKDVTILGTEFDEKGSLEPNREKLPNLLSETTKAQKIAYEVWEN